MPNLSVQTVDFHGQSIQTFLHNDEPHIVMKSIVEGMGLDWSYQYRKLSANKARWGIAVIAIPTKGDIQNALCMPLRKLFGWLMTIQPTRLKKDIQQVVIKYQNECDDVLFDYWSGKSQQPTLDKLSTVETRVPLKDAVNRLVATKKVAYNVAWKMVHQREGVEHANELTEAQVQDALQYVHELTLSNVIEGELLLKDETPKLPELPDGHVNITFNMEKNADYMVRVREGKASRKQLLYCLNPQDEKQDWWLEA